MYGYQQPGFQNNYQQPYGQPYSNSPANYYNPQGYNPQGYNPQGYNQQPAGNMGKMYGYDDSDDSSHHGGDLYQSSRNSFIKKVYTLLSIQLIVTVLFCIWAMNSTWFKNVVASTPLMIVVSVLLMAISIVVACCRETVRKFGLPILIVFTILFAILVGAICARTNPATVLTAAGITALVVIALTLFACFTKTDFTGCGPYLFVVVLVLMAFGFVLFFWRNPIAYLIYSCIAVLLYCIYLVYDTQLILGRYQRAYTLDDAYLAAIQLYIDIVQIFIHLLGIIGFIDN